MLTKNINFKEAVKNVYLCFMVVYMIVREVIPLQFLIDNVLVSVAVFALGFVLVLWDLLTDRDCLKGRPIDFFVAFILISVISSIVNIKYGVASNIKCIAAMVLEYFVFFPQGFKGNPKKTLKIILNTLIITLAFFIVISIGMYFFSIDYSIIANNVSGDQGYDTTWGRLWGVFGDPNVACYVSLSSVFASVYFMYTYKKLSAYILYGINILVQMIFIMLSVSRSGLLLLILIPIITALYVFLAYIKTDKKRALCGVMATLVASVLLYGVYLGLNKSIPYVKAAFLNGIGYSAREKVVIAYDKVYQSCGIEILNIEDNHILHNPEDPDGELDELYGKVEVQEIKRKDEKADYSNGRIARWMGGIEVFKTTPLIGASPRNAVEIAKEKAPDTVMGKYGWVTHCSYLEILVNTGILGAIAMFGCLIYIAVLFLKTAIKKGFDINTYVSFLCFTSIAAGAFFVSDVFFVFSISSLLFFYLLGYLYNYARPEKNGVVYKLFNFLNKGKNE